MKLSRRVVSFILVIACAAMIPALSACHGNIDKPDFVMPDEFDTSRNYEITFWAKYDSNMSQVNVYKKAVTDFQAIYPNVTITIRTFTDYSRIYNEVLTNIPTDSTPNVCITYPDHIATYITGQNTIVPLDELIYDAEYGFGGSEVLFDSPEPDSIVEKFLNECIVRGKYYALPFMRSTEACYINKTYVERLGYTLPEVLTWDFVWEVSEAAMAKDASGNYIVNGQNVLIPFMYKSTDNMMITMLRQLNAGYSNADGSILLFNDTTKSLLLTIAEHTRTGAFSTFTKDGYPGNFFIKGQCIFAIDSTAGATWMGSDAPLHDVNEPDLPQFETAVMTVPQFDTENPQMISQGPSVCVFNKDDPQEVLASWLFAQFLLTNSVQIGYSQTEGYVPVTGAAQNDPEYLDYLARSGEDADLHYSVKIDAAKLLLDNTENSFVTAVFNGSTSVRNAAGRLIENVVQAVKSKETADEAFILKQFDNVTSLYRLDQLSMNVSGDIDMGTLPVTAKVFIGIVVTVWVVLALRFGIGYINKIRHRRTRQN